MLSNFQSSLSLHPSPLCSFKPTQTSSTRAHLHFRESHSFHYPPPLAPAHPKSPGAHAVPGTDSSAVSQSVVWGQLYAHNINVSMPGDSPETQSILAPLNLTPPPQPRAGIPSHPQGRFPSRSLLLANPELSTLFYRHLDPRHVQDHRRLGV